MLFHVFSIKKTLSTIRPKERSCLVQFLMEFRMIFQFSWCLVVICFDSIVLIFGRCYILIQFKWFFGSSLGKCSGLDYLNESWSHFISVYMTKTTTPWPFLCFWSSMHFVSLEGPQQHTVRLCIIKRSWKMHWSVCFLFFFPFKFQTTHDTFL